MSATRDMPAVEVDAKDLPAFCPNPAMPVWCHHPKVFLDITTEGSAKCPYCGTVYKLKGGALGGAH